MGGTAEGRDAGGDVRDVKGEKHVIGREGE